MSDTERLLDIKEAAEFLNVSETSLRRWTNSGRLACLRIGRRRERRFRHADLLAFTELDQSVERAPPARVSRADSRTVAERVSVTHGTHLCGLYSTDEDRVRLGAQFLAGGLAPTGFCYVFGAESARASIVNELERREPSVARDRENGRLITGEYAPSPSLQLELIRSHFESAVAAGARSIRMVGDLAGLAVAVGSRGVAEFEAAYAATIATRFPVVALCQYDARYFNGVDLVCALRAHPDTFHHPQRVL